MSDRVKLTGLWIKDLGDKGKMLGGRVDRAKLEDALANIGTPQLSIAVFKNGFKNDDKKPDYILYISGWEDRTVKGPSKAGNGGDPDFDPDSNEDF